MNDVLNRIRDRIEALKFNGPGYDYDMEVFAAIKELEWVVAILVGAGVK